MRGKVTEVEDENGYKRITPAYAGKSLPRFAGFIQAQDHPRLCGEKSYLVISTLVLMGSPPPMRGKVTLFG
mgnify:CR=1 FL=1